MNDDGSRKVTIEHYQLTELVEAIHGIGDDSEDSGTKEHMKFVASALTLIGIQSLVMFGFLYRSSVDLESGEYSGGPIMPVIVLFFILVGLFNYYRYSGTENLIRELTEDRDEALSIIKKEYQEKTGAYVGLAVQDTKTLYQRLILDMDNAYSEKIRTPSVRRRSLVRASVYSLFTSVLLLFAWVTSQVNYSKYFTDNLPFLLDWYMSLADILVGK